MHPPRLELSSIASKLGSSIASKLGSRAGVATSSRAPVARGLSHQANLSAREDASHRMQQFREALHSRARRRVVACWTAKQWLSQCWEGNSPC
jgi:hypothetical protein